MTALRDEKLGVFSFDPNAKLNACNYYRVHVPLAALSAMGLAETWLDSGAHQANTIQALVNADIALLFATTGDTMGGVPEIICDMKPGKGPDGSAIYPPSLVYDLDDNVDYIHPFNPAFGRLGTRDGNGRLLESGDEITTVMPNGDEFLVWRDRETFDESGHLFDIARNRKVVNSCHAIARLCHGVTVPSKMLAKYYREIHKCPRVYVFPNTVVETDYWYPNLAPRTDDRVRILWQGGQSHMPDWYPLRDALRTIAQRYPQVTFVIWGTKFPWIHDVIPDSQVEYHDWLDYSAYKIKRHGLQCDISLSPLAKSVFNRCKSAIKWYESSIGPSPEASLVSNLPPYSDEVEHGKTALLYDTPDDFVEKLGTLIENAELRRTLAENAREWVRANRSPAATIPGLFAFYQELRAVRRAEALEV